ncbi:adhesion G protein-coupled receptor L4 isoform X3 [Colossoma macropomum]|nr:adhesion G protein-coupled receptor L4 isoform X3 [Colossoma macropomum]
MGYRETSGKVNFTQENMKGCGDINECLEITDICGPDSECHNYIGSYFCTCKDGFVSSNGENKFNASQGVTCDDINKRSEPTEICSPDSESHDIIVSYFCTTKDEFVLSNGEKIFNADHIKVAGFLFFFSVIHCLFCL